MPTYGCLPCSDVAVTESIKSLLWGMSAVVFVYEHAWSLFTLSLSLLMTVVTAHAHHVVVDYHC